MTVVANLPPVVSGGGRTLRMSLMDKSCGPKDMNGTRALFSFPVNSCGFIFEVKLSLQICGILSLCCFALTLYFFFSLEKITWLIKMRSSTRRMTRIQIWFLVMPLRGMNLKTFLLIYIYIFFSPPASIHGIEGCPCFPGWSCSVHILCLVSINSLQCTDLCLTQLELVKSSAQCSPQQVQ